MKVEHQYSVNWSNDLPTLYEAMYCFEEQDRWLPEFVFNNFGVRGNEVFQRMYHRLRELRVDK